MTSKMTFKTIRDFDVSGKRVLVRADLNVPVHHGDVTDTTRIDRLKPTIDYLVEHKAKIVLISHFGRPTREEKEKYSLSFLAPILSGQWGYDVEFAEGCTGPKGQAAVAALEDSHILLLDNIRFHSGEKTNDPELVKKLAALGDVYVNDAFSTAHRAHASTEGLAHALPAAAGLLMEAELNALSQALGTPEKPVAALVGGSKISTKLSVLNNLVKKVDYIILGGGMANTFLFAQGADVGGSLCERDMAEEANEIMDAARENGCEIILPVDCVCVTDLEENAPFEVQNAQSIKPDFKAVDIGPDSVKQDL